MKYELTSEELEAIKIYKNEKNININQLLVQDIETDIALKLNETDIKYKKEDVEQNFEIIKTIYETMIKNHYNNPRRKLVFL